MGGGQVKIVGSRQWTVGRISSQESEYRLQATFSIIFLLKYEHMLIIEGYAGTGSIHAADPKPNEKSTF